MPPTVLETVCRLHGYLIPCLCLVLGGFGVKNGGVYV